MDDESPHVERDERRAVIHVRGALNLRYFRQAKRALEDVLEDGGEEIDLSGLTRLDTAGAMLLKAGAASGKHLRLVHVRPEHKALLTLVERTKVTSPRKPRNINPVAQAIIRLGKATAQLRASTVELITFMGQACVALGGALRHPARLRWGSITHHMEDIGIDALPIIALISFVISVVIAYQGQVQLKPLGAEQYTVNLIAISVLREMGVLLTAIMIAGRSGSAFTAEIGTMKIREETDALRTIGFDPFELLVLPRLIALLVTLPLLVFFADFMGLFGGALISKLLLNISLVQYLEQVRNAATWKDFFAGLIKSPVFAFIIAVVGCMHGLRVSGSAQSVGRETTAAVVQSIFLVLMLDGLFSVYFQKVGI